MNEPPPPGVTVFEGGESGYTWYFFPRLLQTPTGELLVFSEAHVSCGPSAADRGAIDIVLKRSGDHGATWSAVELVHSEHKTSPGTWIGNPAPLIDAQTGTLWLIMSRNNTDVLAMSSQNWGRTWTAAIVISEQVLAPAWRTKPAWQGGWGWVATTGGVQLTVGAKKGRLVVSGDVQTAPTANCSSPYSAVEHGRRGRLGLGLGDGKSCSQSWVSQATIGAFLQECQQPSCGQVMFSDSHGKEWSYSKTLLHPGDEVSNPVQLANGSVIVDMRGHDL